MCGIAGHYCFGNARPTVPTLRRMLVAQEARGRSASGVGYQLPDGNINIIKGPFVASTLAHRITDDQWAELAGSPFSFLHARATTKGPEKDNENNHPVEGGDWMVVHNGMVSNDDDLVAQYAVERPAAVDTVAIPLALNQGRTLDESLGHLALIAGSASFAAYNRAGDGSIILSRLNGPDVYLNFDERNRILYWSSDNKGIFMSGAQMLGGLSYTNISLLPDRAALVLSPSGRVARYEVPRRPFFRPSPPRVMVTTPVTEASGTSNARGGALVPFKRNSGGVLQRSDVEIIDSRETARFYTWLRETSARTVMFMPLHSPFQGIPREDYKRLAKPEPDFTEDRTSLASGIPIGKCTVRTAYGTWRISGDARRVFKPAKRVRPFWVENVARPLGIDMKLPADVALQEALEGTMRLESVEIHYQGVHAYVIMCPWCGILATTTDWYSVWAGRCVWCGIKSFKA